MPLVLPFEFIPSAEPLVLPEPAMLPEPLVDPASPTESLVPLVVPDPGVPVVDPFPPLVELLEVLPRRPCRAAEPLRVVALPAFWSDEVPGPVDDPAVSDPD